jgi:hypothetical protein
MSNENITYRLFAIMELPIITCEKELRELEKNLEVALYWHLTLNRDMSSEEAMEITARHDNLLIKELLIGCRRGFAQFDICARDVKPELPEFKTYRTSYRMLDETVNTVLFLLRNCSIFKCAVRYSMMSQPYIKGSGCYGYV